MIVGLPEVLSHTAVLSKELHIILHRGMSHRLLWLCCISKVFVKVKYFQYTRYVAYALYIVLSVFDTVYESMSCTVYNMVQYNNECA